MVKIELLAPAKDLSCGIAAIDHGADAVYIGASRFGARVAAANSIDDISALCDYAHRYQAKVYATVNTIVYDEELDDLKSLLKALALAHVDAILVQDMGVVTMVRELRESGVPIPPLHASTQTDNRTPEKVLWLCGTGFERAVLARELGIEEISEIHAAVPDMELEAFVHGALCVAYSGACYASQYCFGRSANRGECAQFCRLKFNLEDEKGKTLVNQRYLLSLRDLNRSAYLYEMMKAGVVSFKIEGRLKDINYVKNVVAYYNMQIDEIISHHTDEYQRASLGRCSYSFQPQLAKTFNRGYTDYFLFGRKNNITSMNTPKSTGEMVGTVKTMKGSSFTVSGVTSFSNGDGLCFFDESNELKGFRVNRVDNNQLYPSVMPRGLKEGMPLYRNVDTAFGKQLSKTTSIRKIAIDWQLSKTSGGIVITVSVKREPFSVTQIKTGEFAPAQQSQFSRWKSVLMKMGNTEFATSDIMIDEATKSLFIPLSILTSWRREMVEALRQIVVHSVLNATRREFSCSRDTPYAHCNMPTATLNISNHLSRSFYRDEGVGENSGKAYELMTQKERERVNVPLMQCKHCLRYAFGACKREGRHRVEWTDPLFLRLADGRRFKLEFDCKNCQMNVYG